MGRVGRCLCSCAAISHHVSMSESLPASWAQGVCLPPSLAAAPLTRVQGLRALAYLLDSLLTSQRLGALAEVLRLIKDGIWKLADNDARDSLIWMATGGAQLSSAQAQAQPSLAGSVRGS